MVGLFSNAIVLPASWDNCYTNVKTGYLRGVAVPFEEKGCNMGLISGSYFAAQINSYAEKLF